jgi:hypothetical protein
MSAKKVASSRQDQRNMNEEQEQFESNFVNALKKVGAAQKDKIQTLPLIMAFVPQDSVGTQNKPFIARQREGLHLSLYRQQQIGG